MNFLENFSKIAFFNISIYILDFGLLLLTGPAVSLPLKMVKLTVVMKFLLEEVQNMKKCTYTGKGDNDFTIGQVITKCYKGGKVTIHYICPLFSQLKQKFSINQGSLQSFMKHIHEEVYKGMNLKFSYGSKSWTIQKPSFNA